MKTRGWELDYLYSVVMLCLILGCHESTSTTVTSREPRSILADWLKDAPPASRIEIAYANTNMVCATVHLPAFTPTNATYVLGEAINGSTRLHICNRMYILRKRSANSHRRVYTI